MSFVRSGLLVFALSGALATAQDSTAPVTQPEAASSATVASVPAQPQTAPPAASLNDVMDRVVQRAHYFMAQMRNMYPLVESYLHDMKNDSRQHAGAVRHHYFLGRLDMADGPEDVSFVGQPGFGHRM